MRAKGGCAPFSLYPIWRLARRERTLSPMCHPGWVPDHPSLSNSVAKVATSGGRFLLTCYAKNWFLATIRGLGSGSHGSVVKLFTTPPTPLRKGCGLLLRFFSYECLAIVYLLARQRCPDALHCPQLCISSQSRPSVRRVSFLASRTIQHQPVETCFGPEYEPGIRESGSFHI
jgi:hypothetical protein